MSGPCPFCAQPVHRHSAAHKGTPDDLMGCVNSLRGALEEVEAERDWLLARVRELNAYIEDDRRTAQSRDDGDMDAMRSVFGDG